MGEAPRSTPRTVVYLTDVEGMWPRLESFCAGNPHVRLDAEGRLHVEGDVVFVYGGDAIDRGPAGRRVMATLLDAKRRQPDRVVLLAGNRDINKLRLVRELRGAPPPRAPRELETDAPSLLRWIFEHTMGARFAFEHRRSELEAEGRHASDAAVVESYLDDLAPSGPMRAYLHGCQLAYRAGATLFVHGGVGPESLLFVPLLGHVASVDAWVEALNRFYAEQLAWFERGELDRSGVPRWQPLIAYQAPARGLRLNPESVVYGRRVDSFNNPLLLEAHVTSALREEGVRRLVVGHTPNGDTPSLVREPGFEVVIGDNSHSRLPTASRLVITDARVDASGETLLDGGIHESVRLARASDDEGSVLGLRTRDGFLVKGELESGDLLLFRYVEGYRAEQKAVRADAIERATLALAREPIVMG
jgi:hypothetical protein